VQADDYYKFLRLNLMGAFLQNLCGIVVVMKGLVPQRDMQSI
jgi:hypothetical protein